MGMDNAVVDIKQDISFNNDLSLYIIPILLAVFLDNSLICCFQLKVESVKTPRYLTNCSSAIAILFIFSVTTSFIGLL